jgi:hypothetical protein
MSRGDGMDSLLECVMSGARGFLLLHTIVAGSLDRLYPRLAMGDAYPHRGAPGHAEAWVSFSGSWVRRTTGEIPSIRA